LIWSQSLTTTLTGSSRKLNILNRPSLSFDVSRYIRRDNVRLCLNLKSRLWWISSISRVFQAFLGFSSISRHHASMSNLYRELWISLVSTIWIMISIRQFKEYSYFLMILELGDESQRFNDQTTFKTLRLQRPNIIISDCQRPRFMERKLRISWPLAR
jgi:hypothetical protein